MSSSPREILTAILGPHAAAAALRSGLPPTAIARSALSAWSASLPATYSGPAPDGLPFTKSEELVDRVGLGAAVRLAPRLERGIASLVKMSSLRAEAAVKMAALAKTDDLEKRSKNVREKTRNISTQQRESRLASYVRDLGGFKKVGEGRDHFGIGKDQRGITTSDNGSLAHEVGHALNAPVGSSLREHQQNLGKLTSSKAGMAANQRFMDESSAYNTEPLLYRRAGAAVPNNAYKDNWKRDQELAVGGKQPGTMPSMSQGRAVAQNTMAQYDQGLRAIDKKGTVRAGTGLDARINARAAKKSEPRPPAKLPPDAHGQPGQRPPIEPEPPRKQPPRVLPNKTQRPKPIAVEFTKSEQSRPCRRCGMVAFEGGEFAGCLCWSGLAKSAASEVVGDVVRVAFGDGDQARRMLREMGK